MEGKKYGNTWGDTAVVYRNTLLSTPFKLDKNSEAFYKEFISNFKNKVVVPAALDKFYDQYTKPSQKKEKNKGEENSIDPTTKMEKIAPVYAALSFYAMRQRSISNTSTKHVKLEPVEYLGVTYNTPGELIKGAEDACRKAEPSVEKSASEMARKYNSIEDKLYKRFPNVFEKYYGSNTDFGKDYASIKSEIDGLRKGLINTIKQIPNFKINKENMSREYAAFASLRENPEKFKTYFSTKKHDKSIDDGSIVCICANYISIAENVVDTTNGYASILEGKEIDASTKGKIAPEAIKNAKKFKKMVDELNAVANSENEAEANQLASKYEAERLKGNQRRAEEESKTSSKKADNDMEPKKKWSKKSPSSKGRKKRILGKHRGTLIGNARKKAQKSNKDATKKN